MLPRTYFPTVLSTCPSTFVTRAVHWPTVTLFH